MMGISAPAARPNLLTGEWESDGSLVGLRLENTADKRATATQEIEVSPNRSYRLSAKLIAGAGSVHVGCSPPYRDLFTTHALRPGNLVSVNIKPVGKTICVRLITESREAGAFSEWSISIK